MIEIDLKGKRGLVMGVSNGRSLGWAIAERLAGNPILVITLATSNGSKNCFRLTIIRRSKSDAPANERDSVMA